MHSFPHPPVTCRLWPWCAWPTPGPSGPLVKDLYSDWEIQGRGSVSQLSSHNYAWDWPTSMPPCSPPPPLGGKQWWWVGASLSLCSCESGPPPIEGPSTPCIYVMYTNTASIVETDRPMLRFPWKNKKSVKNMILLWEHKPRLLNKLAKFWSKIYTIENPEKLQKTQFQHQITRG
jgi:hypothetical protein